MVLAILRAVGLALVMLVAVYALLGPFSETSAKRNRKIQFLDPSTRRSLNSQETIDPETMGLAQFAKHIPEQVDPPMAAYFSDPVGKRYPWAFEQHDPLRDEDFDKEQRAFMQIHLWPKALV
ncbi:hypothetical protein Daesc_005972 [Daldinia eschscholtzii]|uniref:Uncharacterized protein n=1 Tax=Daldinia eschscholtzii TaxID=292717 RepID=A0AAX6MMN5_9PEZI